MPYSKFTLSRAVEDFELTVREESNLFAEIEPVVPTACYQFTNKFSNFMNRLFRSIHIDGCSILRVLQI